MFSGFKLLSIEPNPCPVGSPVLGTEGTGVPGAALAPSTEAPKVFGMLMAV
jgi:hypothetical protein